MEERASRTEGTARPAGAPTEIDDVDDTGTYTIVRRSVQTEVEIGRVALANPSRGADPIADALQGAILLVDEVLDEEGPLPEELRQRLNRWKAYALQRRR